MTNTFYQGVTGQQVFYRASYKICEDTLESCDRDAEIRLKRLLDTAILPNSALTKAQGIKPPALT